MTLKECDELETRLSKALIDFVERATKEHATPEEVDDSMLNIKAENLTREEKMALRIVVLKMKRKRRRDKLPRLEYHLNFGDGKSISSR